MSHGIGVTEFLSGLVPPWALPVVLVATMLAEGPVIVSLVVARYWFGNRKAGLRLVAIGTTAVVVLLALKHVFAFPRPPASMRVPLADVPVPFDAIYGELLDTDESAFPSGHTTFAAAVFGGAAMDAGNRRRWVPVAVVLALVVGFSRVFLAVHYLADIAGGLLLGAGIVAAMRLADRWLGSPNGSLALGVASVLVAGAVVPSSVRVVASAGTLVGAAVMWLSVDLPVDPWPVSTASARRALVAVGLAAVVATPLLVLGTTPVLVFVVALVASSVGVVLPAFDEELA